MEAKYYFMEKEPDESFVFMEKSSTFAPLYKIPCDGKLGSIYLNFE